MEGHLLLFAPHQGVHDVAAGVTAAVTEAPLGRFTHHKTLRVTDPTVAAARGVPPTLEAAAHSSRAPRDSRPQTGAPHPPAPCSPRFPRGLPTWTSSCPPAGTGWAV